MNENSSTVITFDVHAAFDRTCGECYRSWQSSREAPLSRVIAAHSGGHMQSLLLSWNWVLPHAASIMPIFPHPPSASRLADVSPYGERTASARTAAEFYPARPRTRHSPLSADNTSPPLISSKKFLWEHRCPSTFSFFEIPDARRFFSSSSSSSSFPILSTVTEDRENLPANLSLSPLAREDATTTRRSTRAAASRSDIPDDDIPTTRRGIRQCGAKRVRARALLSAATESRQRFRGCTCWHGTAMWARTQTGRERQAGTAASAPRGSPIDRISSR